MVTKRFLLMKQHRSCITRAAILCAALWISTSILTSSHAAFPTDENGWTIFTTTSTQRIIYVSSSDGDDATAEVYSPGDAKIGPDPFLPVGAIKPYATVATAIAQMRPGYADWCLLKRGDTWTDPGKLDPPTVYDAGKGVRYGGGPNGDYPQLIGAYGSSSARPYLKYASTAVVSWNGNDITHFNIAWVGLHCYAYTRDPDSPDFTTSTATITTPTVYEVVVPRDNKRFMWLRGGPFKGHPEYKSMNFLLEDMVADYFSDGVSLDTSDSVLKPMENIILRRCIITNSYNGTRPDDDYPDRAQGVWCQDLTGEGLTIEECTLFHNGWNDVMGFGMSMYSHNMYLSSHCAKVRLRGTIACWAGGNAMQMRSGGICENNLFLHNPIGGFLAGGDPGEDPLNICIDNVCMNGIDMVQNDDTIVQRGVGFEVHRQPTGYYANNFVLDRISNHEKAGFTMVTPEGYVDNPEDPPIEITGNIVRDWVLADGTGINVPPDLEDDFTLTSNVVNGFDNETLEPVYFVDPDRNMQTYMAYLGTGEDWTDFISFAVNRPWGQWPVEYSADGFNDYIRAGFTRTAPPPPPLGQYKFYSIAAEDGYVTESSETSNVGGTKSSTGTTAEGTRAGDDGNNKQIKAIYSFDTSAIPDDAIIVSATLRLKRGKVEGTNPFTTLGTCYVDIKGGSGFYGSPDLVKQDFEAEADAIQVATMSNPEANGDWSEGALTSGLAHINLTGKTQFRVYFALDDDNDAANDYIGFFPGETDVRNQPELIVQIGAANQAPTFLADLLNKPDAHEGQAYSGSIAGDASDPDQGDTLTFSKQSGPEWLAVAADGALSGTPGSGDVGVNQFTVRVTDQGGLWDEATLNITVIAAPQTVTFYSVGGEDGYVTESGETSNIGGSKNATGTATEGTRAGDDGKNRQIKAIYSFDTSSIPDSATVTAVTLRLKRGVVSGTNPFTSLGTCYVDIKGGSGFYNNTALEKQDFEAAADAIQAATMSNPAANGDWSEGALTSGLSYVNLTDKTQLRVYFSLDDDNDSANDYIGFYPGEAAAGNQPELVVTYQP